MIHRSEYLVGPVEPNILEQCRNLGMSVGQKTERKEAFGLSGQSLQYAGKVTTTITTFNEEQDLLLRLMIPNVTIMSDHWDEVKYGL